MITNQQTFSLKKQLVIEKLTIEPPFRFANSFQNTACFLHLKEGSAILNSPTEKQNLKIQDTILLKCGNYFTDFLKQSSSGPCEIYAIHLYPEILKEIYKNEIPTFVKKNNKTIYAQKLVSSETISKFIDSLNFYFESPELVNDDLLVLKLKELILLLLQTKSAKTMVELVAHLFTPRQASLNEIISAHIYSNLGVHELAKLASMSLSTFKREFQKLHNETPANYIKDKKLEKGRELLEVSDLSVSEVAYEVGFNDSAHFTRSFHSKYKQSPSKYRKAVI